MWKDWLALSKREQKGFVVLSVILISLILFYYLTPLFFSTGRQNSSDTNNDIQDWVDSVNSLNLAKPVPKSDSLFFFDPNEVTISKLQKLGVKGDGLINWLKYREGGSGFRVSEDILKIYSLDSTLALKLIPFVRFGSGIAKKRKYASVSVVKSRKDRASAKDTNSIKYSIDKKIDTKEHFVIEINSADTAEFAVLKGIGPVLSSRIVLYRNALGGFFSIEQLKEVYGMPANTIDLNRVHLSVDLSAISKIHVNSESLRRLKSHPYINFYLAKSIVEYRKKNDSIKSIDEILSFKEVTPELKNKLSEYLTVERRKKNKK